MAYRPVKLGSLVQHHPEEAAKQLRGLMRAHGSVQKVAVAIGVDRSTVGRWVASLKRQGFDLSPASLRKRTAKAPAARNG